VRCVDCETTAIIDQPYRGAHLCGPHFDRSVERRFDRTLRRQLARRDPEVVAVALSGGKDSATALALTHRFFAGRSRTRVVAISVDEGIAGYRPPTLAAASALSARLGVEHIVVAAHDRLGVTTDAAAQELRDTPPCSFCGVWRRRLLNDAATDAGANALVLGFNLDDLAQTVLMNLARGDLVQVARMAPHSGARAGFVPRLAPLAEIPEREVYLYAWRQRLPFDHGECPHASRAVRNRFREIVWDLEAAAPGTRQALLRARDRIGALLAEPSAPTGRCRTCGGPAVAVVCRSCAFLERMPLPAEVA
jgi:uncharacterized protein (TIGR00269 family)